MRCLNAFVFRRSSAYRLVGACLGLACCWTSQRGAAAQEDSVAVARPDHAGSQVSAIAEKVELAAQPFPLSAVRLTGGPLLAAQQATARYLLELEPDRMLHYYRVTAGLPPKAEPYGGWDGGGRNLTGHIAGHYLSAVSLMYAATGDERFKTRADYLVDELREVQQAHGDGYLSALAEGRACFEQVAQGDIRSGGFDLNGQWAPWYTLHKTYAGLRDAYRYAGNRTALDVEIGFAEWAERILAGLDADQIQRMLNTEFGGMNEVLVDLYVDTGDQRWLDLAAKFEHRAIVDPLKRGEDILPGKHGNTQVPKLIGSLDRYLATGAADDLAAAKFFWERVVHHHSFATGGHGKDEYFGQPDQLSDRIDGRTAESCNIYNMLKLTRNLFAMEPDPQYAAFLERALFNHILGAIDPSDGATCYMVPVGRSVQREYAGKFDSFTCCVGTGLESHALHADGMFFHAGDRQLWLNFYAPARLTWAAAQAEVEVESDFPLGDAAALTVHLQAPRDFRLALLRPAWAGEGFAVKINGEPLAELPETGAYVTIDRTWQDGDRVEVTLPKQLRLEPLADNRQRAAILWGPLVLAGDLSQTAAEPAADAERQTGERRRRRNRDWVEPPVLVVADEDPRQWIEPVADQPGRFRTVGAGREQDVELTPFYSLHRTVYSAYWDLFSPAQWAVKEQEIAAERARQQRLRDATVGYFQPGEMQPERDANFAGEETWPTRVEGRPGRTGRKWYAFELPVDPGHPLALVVTYHSGERHVRLREEFTILVDDQEIARPAMEPSSPPRFFDVQYPIPGELVAGKEKVTVKFATGERGNIASVFGVRMVRADALADDAQASVNAAEAGAPTPIAPPESFFAIVDEGDREAARAFYRKYVDIDGIPAVASAEIADEALVRTHEIVQRMLAGRADIRDQMIKDRMYLIIIGKDQVYTDMPEYRNHPNPSFQNERVRGTGGRPTSFGEENLLCLSLDRYDDESIAVHEFCHTIDGALGRLDSTWRDRLNATYRHALDNGLYTNAYAASNAAEYWAEIAQAYFDCNRVNNWNHAHVRTREQLKFYDPVGYELVRTTFKLAPEQDWRYRWLRELPCVEPPPARLRWPDYYAKFTWAREFPIAGKAASDEAMLHANDTIRKMFAYRHDILKALIAEDAKLVVLGPEERLADLPEMQAAPASIDLLARYADYVPETKLIVVDQTNLLADPQAPGVGPQQVIRAMAVALLRVTGDRPVDPEWDRRGQLVQQYELRVKRLDVEFGAKVTQLYLDAVRNGKWKGSASYLSAEDYWANGVLAYFDAAGQDGAPLDAARPIATREALAQYDPELYRLVDETMAYQGRVDWRYRPAGR